MTAAVAPLAPGASEQSSIVRLLLIHFSDPHTPWTLSRTAARRAEARAAVPTVEAVWWTGHSSSGGGIRSGPRSSGGWTPTRTCSEAQGLIRDRGGTGEPCLGSFLLNLLLLCIFGVLLFFYRPEVYGNFRWVLLLAFLVLAYFLAAAGISWQGYPWELLPIAFVVLPVAILWDGRMALIMALVLGVLTGAQAPFKDFSVLGIHVVGGAAAALSARAVRRRSQTWIFIALITAGLRPGPPGPWPLAAIGLPGRCFWSPSSSRA